MVIEHESESFEVVCDQIEVTMNHRPDTDWRFVDASGHEHRWYVSGVPAASYDPMARHETPTLMQVGDGTYWYDDDGDAHENWHMECVQCGQRIDPSYTSDMTRQFIPGLRRCLINGRTVTREHFEARLKELGYGH